MMNEADLKDKFVSPTFEESSVMSMTLVKQLPSRSDLLSVGLTSLLRSRSLLLHTRAGSRLGDEWNSSPKNAFQEGVEGKSLLLEEKLDIVVSSSGLVRRCNLARFRISRDVSYRQFSSLNEINRWALEKELEVRTLGCQGRLRFLSHIYHIQDDG